MLRKYSENAQRCNQKLSGRDFLVYVYWSTTWFYLGSLSYLWKA